MPICEMSDKHLINTINLLCRNIQEAIRQLSAPSYNNTVLNALYGPKETYGKERAEASIQEVYQMLPFYVLELTLRGLMTSQVAQVLQVTFDRNVGVGLQNPRSYEQIREVPAEVVEISEEEEGYCEPVDVYS